MIFCHFLGSDNQWQQEVQSKDWQANSLQDQSKGSLSPSLTVLQSFNHLNNTMQLGSSEKYDKAREIFGSPQKMMLPSPSATISAIQSNAPSAGAVVPSKNIHSMTVTAPGSLRRTTILFSYLYKHNTKIDKGDYHTNSSLFYMFQKRAHIHFAEM